MARQHAKGCDIFVDEFDFSGISNSVDIDTEVPMAEVTTFTDSWGTFLEGKPASSITVNACYDGDQDAMIFGDLGSGTENIIAISPIAMADAGVIWIAEGICTTDTPTSAVGGAVTMSCNWRSTPHFGWGNILERDTNVTTTTTSSAQTLGAVSATQKVVATLHVLSAAGGTLDVTVQSDTVGFSSPTTQITFSQVTTSAGAQVLTADGPITDTYWRSVCTCGGGAPVYNVLVTMAIVNL